MKLWIHDFGLYGYSTMYVLAETAEQAAEMMTKASKEHPDQTGDKCLTISSEELTSVEIGEVVFHPNE